MLAQNNTSIAREKPSFIFLFLTMQTFPGPDKSFEISLAKKN
jgi:hypothetical protein